MAREPAVSPAPAARSLTGIVLGGVGWSLGSQVVVQVTRVAVGIALARLLTPDEFGVAAMALSFAGLLTIFTDLSLGAALIQRARITESDRSTVFWTTMAVGVALTAAGIGVSQLVADFFGRPEVARLFAFLSLGFILSALSLTQTALLMRELAFRSLQLREVAATLAGAVVGVGLAAAGFGAWAIAAQSVAAGAASAVLLWTLSPWRPRMTFSLESLRDIGGFGIKLFASRLLAFANLNVDNLLVGRFLGAGALGAYALAYNVMFTPILRVAQPIQQVVFPAYARMQDDAARLGAAWLRSKRLSAALLAPAFLGMLVAAPDLVPVVLGGKWRAAVPVLQLLCCAGVAHTLVTLNWSVLQARGRAGTLLRLNAVVSLVTVAAFVVGLRWGIVGVAGSFAVAKWLLVVPDTWITCRAVPVRTVTALRAAGSALPLGLAAAGLAYGVRLLLVAADAPAALRLALVLASGLAAYSILILVAAPGLVTELRQLRRRSPADPDRPASEHASAVVPPVA